jgi:uncharacterized protein (UPF0261 family)
MSAAVVLIASLDTKPDEALFLRGLLEAEGIAVRLLDFGVRDDPAIVPDVSAAETAQRGGGDLARLRQAGNRAVAIDVMAKGAASALRDISERGELLGVLAIGGSGGTTVGTAAMRARPARRPQSHGFDSRVRRYKAVRRHQRHRQCSTRSPTFPASIRSARRSSPMLRARSRA